MVVKKKSWTDVYKKLEDVVSVETETGNTFVLRRPNNLQSNQLARDVNALIKAAKNGNRPLMDAEILGKALPMLMVSINDNNVEDWTDADFDDFIGRGLEMTDTKRLVEELYVLQGNDREDMRRSLKDFP